MVDPRGTGGTRDQSFAFAGDLFGELDLASAARPDDAAPAAPREPLLPGLAICAVASLAAAWLAEHGMRLEAFEESHFYSDSMSDLPLLTSVTHPVAVDPDARLLAHAQAAGWPVLTPG